MIFTSDSFIEYVVELPSGQSVTNPTDVVNIIKSDGTTETIFQDVNTALRCLNFMVSRNQYYLQANDDVIIVNVSGTKLLVLETTFLNQKLLNSFNMVYARGKVVCNHRNMTNIMSLSDALKSVGLKSNGVSLLNNYDLETNVKQTERPHIKVVDINYKSSVTISAEGSVLEDPLQIIY